MSNRTFSLHKPKPLRCYFAGAITPSCDEFEFVEACFARNATEARALIWREGRRIKDECENRRSDLRLQPRPDLDFLADKHEIFEPRIVWEDKILRDMGWRVDGDEQCAHCERFSLDGLWPVCEECDRCSECGHEDGCQDSTGAGARHP